MHAHRAITVADGEPACTQQMQQEAVSMHTASAPGGSEHVCT